MKHPIALILRLAGLVLLTFSSAIAAMGVAPATVSVYAEHHGGKIVYHYRVTNISQNNIAAVEIGYDTKNDSDDNNDSWELLGLPSGWDFYTGIPPTSATSPLGWHVYVITLEESELLGIRWETIDDNSPELYPSQTFTEMSVTLDKADINYITGHAFIIFSSKPKTPTAPTVPLERLDTAPPTLSVTLSPTTLWPPNNKPVQITATVTAIDDYDPEPEIKLESITANETLADGDILDAQLATDDRSFSLAAKRDGNNMAGRIYTVTYSATDASGNKTTASATITVPHDQGK